MSNEKLSSLLLDIGQATKEGGKGADARFSMIDEAHRFAAAETRFDSMHELLALCLTRKVYPKLTHERESYPTSILQISRSIGYANRTLVSAYCQIGKGLELYDMNSRGRALLVSATPTFDIWKDLAIKHFKSVISFIDYLTKYLDDSPEEVRHSISELKQAFFIAQTLEDDVMTRRRYEILANETLNALIMTQPKSILIDIVRKLEVMEEMKQARPEELLRDFKVTEHEGKVSIDWTGSGSAERQPRKSSRTKKPTISIGS